MPLPLPDLDTRTWDDLVAEGRALIPRYAPGWTDHNLHDPGITLIDLLAWLVEMDVYALDRVPEASRRRFLALVGATPHPPRAAEAVLWSAPAGPGSVTIPAGAEFTLTIGDSASHRFVVGEGVAAAPVLLTTMLVQPDPNAPPQEAALFRREGGFLAVLGDDPAPGAALWLGFNESLPVGETVRLYIAFAGGRSGLEERRRIEAELAAQAESCRRPLPPTPPCASPTAPPPATTSILLRHHGVRLAWEIDPEAAPSRTLDPASGEVSDGARDLSLDGFVDLRTPVAMAGTTPNNGDPRAYVRVRMINGSYDAPPLLAGIVPNAFPVRQAVPLTQPFRINPGAVITGSPPSLPGSARLNLSLDASGDITDLDFAADEQSPAVGILYYQPPTASAPGLLLAELTPLGRTNGAPLQAFRLPGPLVEGDSLEVFTLEGPPGATTWQTWQVRSDWDASGGRDAHVRLDHTNNLIVFPDGNRGRIPARDAGVFVRALTTVAGVANTTNVRAIVLPPTLRNWALFRADDLDAQIAALGVDILLGQDLERVWEVVNAPTYIVTVASLGKLAAAALPAGGAAAESVAQAAARAVADLAAPTRAITPSDVETLALATPGTAIARVGALPRQHPALPCLVAPGLVTVVVVPDQRRARPEPSPGLLTAVLAYLDRRRLVGTRLAVVGPSYLSVSVNARVRARFDANPERVRTEVLAALDAFLHPLRGGPAAIAQAATRPAAAPANGFTIISAVESAPTAAASTSAPGWPFGRDVYRAEVLQVIDGVAGVDYVLSLELSGDGNPPQCGNLCVGPTLLVTAGPHLIEVVR
jgi:hypothetical protein